MELTDSIWVEKWRPKELGDLVLSEGYRETFERFIKNREISNLLFSGTPGSGKTTVARILTSKQGVLQNKNDNLLEVNGSSKEARGITYVQDVIEKFLRIPPMGRDKHKIVFIDEADFLCLRGDQEVIIIENNYIKDVGIGELEGKSNINVLSFDLEKKIIEIDNADYVDSGYAEMFEVELENGEKMVCSEDHPFFVLDGENIVEKKLKDITKEDNIVELEGISGQYMKILNLQNYKIKTTKIKKVTPVGLFKAHNLSVQKNKNFILSNGVLTHNTEYSFSAMRNIIERYSKYGRFIFTCNYISKIPPAIQSRMQGFPFKKLPVNFIKDYCETILKTEKIQYEEKDVDFVIDALYPDVRKVVNTLQKDSMTGKLIVNREAVFTIEKKISSIIVDVVSSFEKNEKSKISKSLDEIIKLLYDQDLEFRGLYTTLFFLDGFPTPAKIIVNKYSNSHKDCLVPQMHFIAMVFEVMKALQDYRTATGK